MENIKSADTVLKELEGLKIFFTKYGYEPEIETANGICSFNISEPMWTDATVEWDAKMQKWSVDIQFDQDADSQYKETIDEVRTYLIEEGGFTDKNDN